MTHEYLQKMSRSGQWVDAVIVQAMARMLNKDIFIVTSLEASTALDYLSNVIPGGKNGARVTTDDMINECILLGHVGEHHYISLKPKKTTKPTDNPIASSEPPDIGLSDSESGGISHEGAQDTAAVEKQQMDSCDSSATDSDDNGIRDGQVNQVDLPKGVSSKSWVKWRKTRPWLDLKNGKVTCSTCAAISRSGMGTSKTERLRIEEAFVLGVACKRKKLLKKIDKHAKSQSHKTCMNVKVISTQNKLTNAADRAKTIWEQVNKEKIDATCKVFNVAYTVATEELSFLTHTALIEVMEKNGMGHFSMLFSDHACSDICEHIAASMKHKLIDHINNSGYQFSVLVDESTTLSGKTALIIYIRIQYESDVCSFFFGLVELSNGATGLAIADAIYQALVTSGISHETLKAHMMSFASDGASVMRGEHLGTVAQLKKILGTEFISFHCMAHRLELAVNGAVKSCGEIERLQLFTDSLYAFYHRSPKNLYELSGIADSLQCQLLKISQIFTVRWVFSTYRAVKAFLQDYAPLCTHMEQVSVDKTRLTKEKAKCKGFAKKLRDWRFVAELLLLADCLEVLWNLSAFLQSRSASITDVYHKLNVARKTLLAMKTAPGINLSKLLITSDSGDKSSNSGEVIATDQLVVDDDAPFTLSGLPCGLEVSTSYDGITLSRTEHDEKVHSE